MRRGLPALEGRHAAWQGSLNALNLASHLLTATRLVLQFHAESEKQTGVDSFAQVGTMAGMR